MFYKPNSNISNFPESMLKAFRKLYGTAVDVKNPHSWIKHFNRAMDGLVKRTSICIIYIIMICAVSLQCERLQERVIHETERDRALEIIHNIQLDVERNVGHGLLIARSIRSVISLYGDIGELGLSFICKDILSGTDKLIRVAVARGTLISFVYPREGNQAAVGADYKNVPRQWPSVEKAIRTKSAVIDGPVQLIQGGEAVIVRYPIFYDRAGEEMFYGIISIVLNLKEIIDSSLQNTNDYLISVQGSEAVGADNTFLYGDKGIYAVDPVISDRKVIDTTWRFALAPVNGWAIHSHRDIIMYRIVCAVFILINIVSAIVLLIYSHRSAILRKAIRKKVDENTYFISALNEQIAMFKALVDAIPGGFFYKSNEGRYLGCNETFLEFTGFTKSEIIGSTVFDLYPTELADVYHVADERVFDGREFDSYETQVKNLNGSLRDVIISKSRFNKPDGSIGGLVGIVIDISDRKRLEDYNKQALIEANIANLAKSRLLATISHELRTPLNAIIGFSSFIQQITDTEIQDRQQIMEYGSLIFNSGRRLLDTVEDIICISSLSFERKAHHFDLIPISSRYFIELMSIINSLADQRQVDFSYSLDYKDVSIYSDTKWLKQIIFCVCENAVKFNRTNGSITLSAVPDPGGVTLICEDTGVGIPPECLDLVYEPFYRVEEKLGKFSEGAGLGLSIVKKLMGLHNGFIKIDSQYGKGTTVRMWFPNRFSRALDQSS